MGSERHFTEKALPKLCCQQFYPSFPRSKPTLNHYIVSKIKSPYPEELGYKVQAADFSQDETNTKLSAEEKIELYRQMIRIRRFEERSLRVYQGGNIGGFLHLYIGQEAIAVGTCSLMGDDDHVITTYRDHGHALAVGMSMNECMAELTGKYTGCSKGKGGSMHFFAPDKNFWGGHGIVGGQTPLGAGLAFGLKHQGKKGCCMCYMGDGATNQGAFYESLNLAVLWNLPVIYIIENNGYSMGTALERHSAGLPLTKRAQGVGMDYDMANGNDIYEVRSKTAAAIKRAHEESKPTLIEIMTYRYRGHSVADPDETYRSKEEIKDYRDNKDPISLYQKNLLESGAATEEQLKEIDKAARKEADESAKFADESPYPPVESIMEDIYWEEDNRTEATPSEGKIYFELPPEKEQ